MIFNSALFLANDTPQLGGRGAEQLQESAHQVVHKLQRTGVAKADRAGTTAREPMKGSWRQQQTLVSRGVFDTWVHVVHKQASVERGGVWAEGGRDLIAHYKQSDERRVHCLGVHDEPQNCVAILVPGGDGFVERRGNTSRRNTN